MASFPYNSHEHVSYEVNGCPIDYQQARELADTVRFWHGCIAKTDSWTQSSDGAEADITYMALGLMELLSDPGAVGRLIMVGEHVRVSVRNLLDMPDDDQHDIFAEAKKVVGPLFAVKSDTD